MQCLHHALSDTHTTNSSNEAIQGEVSYNQEYKTLVINFCELDAYHKIYVLKFYTP